MPAWPRRARLLTLTATAAAAMAGGCGPKRVVQTPGPRPQTTLIALLPDPETGITGRAHVANEFGAASLDAPREATQVSADGPPSAVSTIDEVEVARRFGAALAALPPEPRHFTLHFEFESDSLTDESSQKVPGILSAVKRLAVPEVVVVGHTDTLGGANANAVLGLKRAMSVRNVLVAAGIPPSMIEVASHGEADLLVKTRNNTAEPRNRRVEISVR